MKPLLEKDIQIFMQRFDSFRDAEFRSLEVISPTEINLSFGVQDRARAFDWISLEIILLGVKNAKLLNLSKLDFIDMSDGVTFVKDNLFAFCIGKYNNITNMQDAIIYVFCDTIKYREGKF